MTPSTFNSNNAKSQSLEQSIRQPDWLALLVILLIAIALRLYQLGEESLWIDEMLSIRDAERFTWSDPGVRPLYYFMLQQWMKLGTGDVWLRSLALIFDIGSVALTYVLGRYTVSRQVGAIAALMFALSPMLINHAQEIRMYSPGIFFCLAGTMVLAYALDRINPGLIGAWIVLRLLAVITFPLNLMLIGADVLLLLWRFRDRRRVLIGFGIGLAIMGLALIPYWPTLLAAIEKFSDGWSATLETPGLIDVITKLVDFSTLWPSYIIGKNGLPFKALYGLYSLGLAAWVGFALWDRRRATERFYWVAVWAIAPLLPILVKSWVSSSLWVSRYLLFTAPYFFILMAQGLLGLFQRQKWIGIGVAVIYGAAVTGGLGYYYHTVYRDDWKAAAAIVEAQAQPGDVVAQVADIPWAELGFERYYTGDLPTYFVPDLLDPDNDLTRDYFLPEVPETNPIPAASAPEAAKELEELTQAEVENILEEWGWPDQVESRLWLVCRDYQNPVVAAQVERILTAVMSKPYTIAQTDRVFDGVSFAMTLDVMLVVPEAE